MAEAPADLETVLKDAHLPALLTALVHMTGETGWLRPEWAPAYNPMDRHDIGVSAAVQDEARHAAAEAIRAYLAGKPLQMEKTDTATLRLQMDFVAGAPIPEQYVDFLVDELTLAGKSTKDPQFGPAAAPGRRAEAEGAGDRRRHDRFAGRHPPDPGRRAVRDRRQERRRRRHLVREHLSGLPGRQLEPHV